MVVLSKKVALAFASIVFPLALKALPTIDLPPGFSIETYANVPAARQMALGDQGTVFVGTSSDKVYALIPNKNGTQAQQAKVIASGLDIPNGVAFHHGDLYIAEIPRLSRLAAIEENLNNPPDLHIIRDDFPNKKHHGRRVINISPDNQLVIGIGAPCNVCLSSDPQFGTLIQMSLDGSDEEIIARGVRNSVGFDWNPKDNSLWFTDNGRDWLGDNLPPDELNHLTHKNQHFGFPYRYGNNIPDPQFGKKAPKGLVFTPPAQPLGPHVAALGMVFYRGKQFPKQYQNQIFIAEHGSWNRSKKIGYRITLVTLDENNKPINYQPFATGWLKNEDILGRPVDLLNLPDGSLLVSDDYAGKIYRISYALQK